jgi:sugar phosphate isomerase/epimerase
MYSALNAGAIRVNGGPLPDLVARAKSAGFKGVEISITEAADLIDRQGLPFVRDLFAQAGVVPAGWGLPTDWRKDDATFAGGLAALPRLARAAAALECRRTATWILSWDDHRTFPEAWTFHVDRFRAMAKVLADHGCSVGLEFLGPRTLYAGKAHEFIHTMEKMLEMCDEIGPNAGLLLDSWHWHASGGTVEAIRKTTPERIVYVHVNDAPMGVAVADLIDNTRCLPGETGVIDITGFLRALDGIGYRGPVVAEPFKKELADLPSDDARMAAVAASLAAIFRAAGLDDRV